MSGAVRPAVKVAERGRSESGRAAGGAARGQPPARRERGEHRFDPRDDLGFAADHEAISLLEPEHAAARADVEIVDAGGAELGGAPDVVLVVGIAAVDQHVARGEHRAELGDHPIDDRRRQHDPDGARGLERAHQLPE